MENSEIVDFLPLESAQNTDPGRKRSNNEDWVAGFEPTNPLEIQSSGSLYIVADGVGGASRGERASQYAAERVLYNFFQEPDVDTGIRLQKAMQSVCNEIFEYAQNNNLSRMATTMVAANIRGNVLTVANVGDSRCYILRSGKVVQITQDHNYAAELVRNGSLTAEEAKHAKSGNTLLRSIGGDPDVDVDIFGEIDLFPGDIVLLCSDGLTRYADSDTLLKLCADGTAEQMSQRLIDFANNSGGADNISVYVIKVGSDAVNREFDEETTIPTPITLDSPKAKKSTKQKKAPLSLIKPLTRGKIINIGLVSLLFLVLFSGVFYLMRRDKDGNDDAGKALLSSPTSELPIAPIGDPTTPMQNATPTTEPTSTTDVNQSVNSTPTITPIPQEIPPVSPTNVCVHVVQEGEQISTIFLLFNLNYAKYEDEGFFRYTDCNIENEVCSDNKVQIVDPGLIRDGQYLIIEEANIETCESVEGNNYWISVNP